MTPTEEKLEKLLEQFRRERFNEHFCAGSLLSMAQQILELEDLPEWCVSCSNHENAIYLDQHENLPESRIVLTSFRAKDKHEAFEYLKGFLQ